MARFSGILVMSCNSLRALSGFDDMICSMASKEERGFIEGVHPIYKIKKRKNILLII